MTGKYMKHISVTEAKKKFGEEIINQITSENIEPTSRLIYPGYPHYSENEWVAGSINVEDWTLTAYCYLTDSDSPEDVTNDDFEIEIS